MRDRPTDGDGRPDRESDRPGESGRADGPWRQRTDAEIKADFEAQDKAVREDRAENPRRFLGRPSESADSGPSPDAKPSPPADQPKPDEQGKPEPEQEKRPFAPSEKSRLDHREFLEQREHKSWDEWAPKREQERRREATQREGEKLPEWQPRDKTRGTWIAPDGTREQLVSGNDERKAAADRLVAEAGEPPVVISSHVEVKFAMKMRELGLKDESIATNRRPCRGQFGCDTYLPDFVPPGGSLTVYGPDGFEKTYRGKSGDDDQR